MRVFSEDDIKMAIKDIPELKKLIRKIFAENKPYMSKTPSNNNQ
jgi:hypothetical protein